MSMTSLFNSGSTQLYGNWYISLDSCLVEFEDCMKNLLLHTASKSYWIIYYDDFYYFIIDSSFFESSQWNTPAAGTCWTLNQLWVWLSSTWTESVHILHNILWSVSMVHECGGSCTFIGGSNNPTHGKRGGGTQQAFVWTWWDNVLYCYNMYCSIFIWAIIINLC